MGYRSLGRRIGNRARAFAWYQFQWPWVTSNPNFKLTIITPKSSKMVQDSYNDWPIESRIVYQTALFSMILKRPLTRFSRSRYSLTLDISQTATAIVTINCEAETVPKLSNGTSLNDREWFQVHWVTIDALDALVVTYGHVTAPYKFSYYYYYYCVHSLRAIYLR